MKILERGYIHDGRSAAPYQRFCARTAILEMQDGTLIASCRLGSARQSVDGHEAVFASADAGRTWELRHHGYGQGAWEDGTPGEVFSFTPAETSPGLLTATGIWMDRTDPELPMTNPATQGFLPMRMFHTTSADGGFTWGPRRGMDSRPHRAASSATQAVRPLPDGLLAQPYEWWKEYDDPSPGRPGCCFRVSRDGGLTWPEFLPVALHPQNLLYYWDIRLAVHPESGQWVAMFWTHEPAAGVDRDVHVSWGAPDARSWTAPAGTGLPGQHCDPVPLGGDRLMAVYSHRDDPPGIAAAVSDDFGRTWDRGRDLMIYESNAGTEPGARGPRSRKEKFSDMEAWRFGHPRGELLRDGSVFIVFYAGGDDVRSARWAKVET